MLRTARHEYTMLRLSLLLLLLSLCHALVNVASNKYYTVIPPGFHEVIFRSHNNQGYNHVSIQLDDNRQLTNDNQPVVSPRGCGSTKRHSLMPL